MRHRQKSIVPHTPTTSTTTPTPTITPTPTPTLRPPPVFSGSITTADPTETNRLTRNAGTGSVCGVQKAFPGTQAGTFHYDAYTFTNPSAFTVCISVNLTNSCTNNVFTEAYSPSFNPASISTNYLADPSTNLGPHNYSFNVGPGASFV